NVRQAEKLVTSKAKEKSVPASAKPAPDMKDADTLALERNMTALLGLQVDISSRSSGGALVIHYKTLDQLDDVLHRLSNGPRGASSIPADSADISFSNDMSDLNEIFDESMDDIIADTEPEPDQDSMSSAEDSLDDAFDEQDPVEDGDLMIGDQSDSDDEMLGLEDDDLEGEGFEDVVSENNTLSESMSAISKIIGDDASTADLAEDGSITASMDSISKLLGEESESSDTSDEDETGDDLESVPDSDTTDDNADEKEIRIKDLID
ncbi:MAG: hypothetical protein HON65_04895, partial [Rhodospirillales bacterium]|nr:hypothetical protein [Rhodospirillales bacterium]